MLLAPVLLTMLMGTPAIVADDPVRFILNRFVDHRVVALGENHGHREFHDLVIRLLEAPGAAGVIDDIAVEWGNALYQDVIDRFIGGAMVPWDSVSMAWRNTVTSPNTVWDAPVYERFFREVRRINAGLADSLRYRVILADSPVDWARVDSIADLRPFFDRAAAMATSVRQQSLLKGRRALFLAGGLHVHRLPRSRPNRLGVPTGEITPVAWIELWNPGVTYVIQSMGRIAELGLPELVGREGPDVVELVHDTALASIPASAVTTLRDGDGTRPDVYPRRRLQEIVDAVIRWDTAELSFPDPDPATYRIDWYWEELNRRSMTLRRSLMDPSLRDETKVGQP